MTSDDITEELEEELYELDFHWVIRTKGHRNWCATILTERNQAVGSGTGDTLKLAISAAVTNYYANK